MTVETIRGVLAWCVIMNFGLLLWWFLFFVLAHDWIYRLHTRWFKLTTEQFDTLHYGGMAVFKLAILLLNLVPYLAMRIVH